MLDSLGRDVGNIKDNVQAIKAQMLQDIGKSANSNADPKGRELLGKLSKQLETIVGYRLDDELKKFHTVLDKLTDECKKLNKAKSDRKKEATETGKAISKAMGSGNDPLGKAAKMLQKAANQLSGKSGVGRIPGQPARYSGSRGTQANSISDLCRCICNCIKKLNGGGGNGGGGGGSGKSGSGGSGRRGGKGNSIYSGGRLAGSAIGNLLTDPKPVESLIGGLGKMISKGLGSIPIVGGFLEGLTDAVLKPLNEELEFFRGMSRSIIVNYSTGLDSVAKKLEEFEITDKDILVTGQSRSVLLKEQQKFYKRGITDAKTLNKVMRVGLQTATMIDSDAESTADMFADWSQHLGASERQLGMMSRGLVNIGRQTGLTGDNLLRVAKSSEDFMKNMRLAGTFSAGSANNIMGVLASAQKTGTTTGASKILSGLSGGLLGNTVDEQTKNLIMKAGAFGGADTLDLISGVGTDKDSMRKVASGLESVMKLYTQGRSPEQMTKQQRGLASQMMFQNEGFKLEELRLTIKNLKEGAKSFEDQLQDVDDSLRMKLIEPLEAQAKREAILFAKAEDTVDKFSGSLNQMNPELNKALDTQVELLNGRLGRVGGGSFSRSEGESNETLIARIQKVSQEVNAKELGAKDPYLKIQTAVFSIENALRKELIGVVVEWLPKIGEYAENIKAWVLGPGKDIFGNVVTILGQIAGFVGGILGIMDPVKNNKDMLDNTEKAQRAGLDAMADRLKTYNTAGAVGSVTAESLAASQAGLAAAKGAFKEGTGYSPEGYKAQQASGSLDVGAWLKNKATGGGYSQGVATMYEQIQAKEQEVQAQEFLLWLSNKRNQMSPEQQGAFDEKVGKYFDVKQKMGAASMWDRMNFIPELMKAQGELTNMAENANEPGSIYTHDMHLEKLLQDVPTLVSAMMPGVDIDEEIQKRQIAIDDSNAAIEANTDDIASNTSRTNVLLGALLSSMRRGRGRGADTTVDGENLDESVFYDQFIDYDWIDSIARMVGNTWNQGNPGKHN